MKPSGIAAFLLVGAILLGVGVISRRWITFERGEGSSKIGLHSGEQCYEGRCESFWFLPDIDKVRRGQDIVMVLSGTLAGLLGIATAILAGIAALLLFQKGRPRGLALTAIILVSIALVNSFAFIGAADPPPAAGFGVAMFAFLVGGVLVLIGSIMARSGAPQAMPMGMPGYGMPPMGYQHPHMPTGHPGMHAGPGAQPGYGGQMQAPPQPGPQCPRCGNISTWVPQYQRGFCNACNSYV